MKTREKIKGQAAVSAPLVQLNPSPSVTATEAQKILTDNGLPVTKDQAAEILNFLYCIGKNCIKNI